MSEMGQVAVRRNDLKVRAFPQPHGGAEILDDEGDRLSEIAVGRIADQAGTGMSWAVIIMIKKALLADNEPNSGERLLY